MPNRVAAHVTSYLSKADIEDQGLDVDSYAVYHPLRHLKDVLQYKHKGAKYIWVQLKFEE